MWAYEYSLYYSLSPFMFEIFHDKIRKRKPKFLGFFQMQYKLQIVGNFP